MEDVRRAGRLAPEKRQRILRAALATFFEAGYEGSSVDEIASRAGVSKATVYNHFEDKQALFVACLLDEADALAEAISRLIPAPAGQLEEELRSLGERMIRLLLSPAVARLHRVIAAEVSRFPELGRCLYERGVTRFRGLLARFFEARRAAGELELDDPGLAAMQFLTLASADLKMRVELGMQAEVTEEEIRQAAACAAGTFLRAYRPRPAR